MINSISLTHECGINQFCNTKINVILKKNKILNLLNHHPYIYPTTRAMDMSSSHTWHHLDHVTLCLGTSFDLQVPCFIPKIAMEPENVSRSFWLPTPSFSSSRISTEIFISLLFFWQLDIVPETCLWGGGGDLVPTCVE